MKRAVRWLKSQFIEPHTWRDADIEYWWQMPADPTRTASPWAQLVADLFARASFSEWHEKVAESRVLRYDRLRPSVTRAALLCVIGGSAALLSAPARWWLMLVPAALQVVLE